MKRRRWGSLAKLIPYPTASLEYQRAWRRLNPVRVRVHRRNERKQMRERLDLRVNRAKINARYRAKNRERRNAGTKEWRRNNKEKIQKSNRKYYTRVLKMVCHFCGHKGTDTHPLRRMSRNVIQGEKFVAQKVLLCRTCRE